MVNEKVTLNNQFPIQKAIAKYNELLEITGNNNYISVDTASIKLLTENEVASLDNFECYRFAPFNVYGDGRVNIWLVQAPDPSAEKETGRSRVPFKIFCIESAARIGGDESETIGVNVDPQYCNHIRTRLEEIGGVSRSISARLFFVVARQDLACGH